MINLIMNNIELIACIIVLIPLCAGIALTILMVIDSVLSQLVWYNMVMHGKPKVDEIAIEEFFGKSFKICGIVNIITPCVVVYLYLSLTNIPFSVFINSWRP